MLGRQAIAPAVLVRARADQVATLYGQWHRTTQSMAFGVVLLCTVLWQEAAALGIAAWIAAIVANQGWRGALVAAYRRIAPGPERAARWGAYWTVGSTVAGALWGVAAIGMFPASAAHQALLIVCLFGVVLGGLNLTAVYKPAFYGFVCAALVPLIARVGWEGDEVHLFTALVMGVVLAFVLTYGHRLNDLLTQSLAMRYENTDLIAALTAQTEAAEAARAAAETANRAKSQFLAAASHDLRQPLHAMGLFAAALAGRVRDPGVTPLVQSIHASVEALEGLFSQLLDLSRLEAGALTPDISAIALQPIFDRIARDLETQASAAGLVLRIHATPAVVLTDQLLLERILRNLVANALRYTPTGGVVVGARRRGSTVRIDVVDTGIGIAPTDRARIFEEFVQVEGAAGRMRRGHGMGLGLAIVRRLATLLEHRVEVASTPGRGSRFSVHLDRAPTHRLRQHPADCARASHAMETTDQALFARRRFVVIDDDPGVTGAMTALFETWGADVVAAGTVDEALQHLAECGADPRVDLLVVDLRLGEGASGIDAVTRMRHSLNRTIAALIVSGDTSDDAAGEAATAGIALLHKPVMAMTLRHAAEAALAVGGPVCERVAAM
ncbi:MAG: hybrid sensor histidine kinase/response regulator [Casimicrobiaceae bacterium]